jgi:hypothetical protein
MPEVTPIPSAPKTQTVRAARHKEVSDHEKQEWSEGQHQRAQELPKTQMYPVDCREHREFQDLPEVSGSSSAGVGEIRSESVRVDLSGCEPPRQEGKHRVAGPDKIPCVRPTAGAQGSGKKNNTANGGARLPEKCDRHAGRDQAACILRSRDRPC